MRQLKSKTYSCITISVKLYYKNSTMKGPRMKALFILLMTLALGACAPQKTNPQVSLDDPAVVPAPGTMYSYTLELPADTRTIALHLMPVGPSAPTTTPISVVNFVTDPAVHTYSITSVYASFMLSNVDGGPLPYMFTKVNTRTGEVVLQRSGTVPVGDGLYWFDY